MPQETAEGRRRSEDPRAPDVSSDENPTTPGQQLQEATDIPSENLERPCMTLQDHALKSPALLTESEARELAGLTIEQLLNLAVAGRIRYRKRDGVVLYRRDDVLRAQGNRRRRHRKPCRPPRKAKMACSDCGKRCVVPVPTKVKPRCWDCGGPLNLPSQA